MRVVRRARFGCELQRLAGESQPEALYKLRDALRVHLEPVAVCECAQNLWLEVGGASKFYQFTMNRTPMLPRKPASPSAGPNTLQRSMRSIPYSTPADTEYEAGARARRH